MAINITTYIRNLINGRRLIVRIFNNVSDARFVVSIGGRKTYLIEVIGIGKKNYTSCELFKLDEDAFCNSLENIFDQIDNIPTLDQYIKILLKGKNEILGLYQAYFNAEDRRTNGGTFCYTFNNPYGMFVNLNKNRIQLSGPEVINLFRGSDCIISDFDPLLVIGTLF